MTRRLNKPHRLLALLWAAVLATSAAAAGKHAGGHDADMAAIGQPGKLTQVTRTIEVNMSDAMRFTPADLQVRQNETIRFVVKNSGKLKHELVLGTDKALADHALEMKKNPEMEHAEPNQVSVAPGRTGEIIWRFTKAGKVSFACLQPGHFDAGMKGVVLVSANAALAEGEIRKVDKEAGKLTIAHGEIKNLDMPRMTMVFQVKDPAMLDRVKAGDKVRFSAEKLGGAFVVTDLQPGK